MFNEELEEILKFPKHSKEQIDQIIDIIDEYGACDERLKKKIYNAFKVKN